MLLFEGLLEDNKTDLELLMVIILETILQIFLLDVPFVWDFRWYGRLLCLL